MPQSFRNPPYQPDSLNVPGDAPLEHQRNRPASRLSGIITMITVSVGQPDPAETITAVDDKTGASGQGLAASIANRTHISSRRFEILVINPAPLTIVSNGFAFIIDTDRSVITVTIPLAEQYGIGGNSHFTGVIGGWVCDTVLAVTQAGDINKAFYSPPVSG